jgi:hypothetical protein
MPRTLATILLAGTAALGGCASLSESQCLAGDWQTVGYRDGSSGQSHSALLKHQNACVKHGVTPDREAYLAGWDQGIIQYCQPRNGFALGERGVAFPTLCPDAVVDPFEAAYHDGRRLYLARAEIRRLEREIDAREHRLEHLDDAIASAESRLVEDGLSSAERRELLEETKQMSREQGEIEVELKELRIDVALEHQRLQQLRHALASAS